MSIRGFYFLQHERAESLIQEGLRGLPNDPEFALARLHCLVRGSEVAAFNGAPREAIERAQSAQPVCHV